MKLQDDYKMKMRKLFNLYNDWLFPWGFPDGRGLVKHDYLIPFFREMTKIAFMIIRDIYKK